MHLQRLQSGDQKSLLVPRYRRIVHACRLQGSVYKVETIGDAYLVVSGLPTVYERHAQEMSLLALELLDSVKQHVIPHLPDQELQIRVGLHSGESP